MQQTIPSEVIDNVFNRIDSKSIYLKGRKVIHSNELRSIIGWTHMPKYGINRLSRANQREIIKILQDSKKIRYATCWLVEINSELKNQQSETKNYKMSCL